MNRRLLVILCILFSITGFTQVVKQGQLFSSVPVVDGKVVFLKEIPLKAGISREANFQILKEWARANYGKDPFISSVRYDNNKEEIIAKSRIELLLPANGKGIREKMVMRYRVNAFMFNDKYVLEVKEIAYLYDNPGNDKMLPKVIRAEDFITDTEIAKADNLQEIKQNTRKSTFYFLNELGKDFESKFVN